MNLYEAIEIICNDYCKYPDIESGNKLADICDRCPMNKCEELRWVDHKTEKMADGLIRKSDVLETYADLYDIFDDNKTIQEELHKVFDKINNIPAVESNNSEIPNNCETCRHYKLACELFSEICKYEPKDEPLTADYCDTCDHKECEYCIADSSNPYCVPSNYHKVEDESTISKMEQVDEPTGYNLSPVEDESQTADVCTWDGKVGEIEIHNIFYEPTYNEDDGSM